MGIMLNAKRGILAAGRYNARMAENPQSRRLFTPTRLALALVCLLNAWGSWMWFQNLDPALSRTFAISTCLANGLLIGTLYGRAVLGTMIGVVSAICLGFFAPWQ
jgi:hypothetical protein